MTGAILAFLLLLAVLVLVLLLGIRTGEMLVKVIIRRRSR